MIGAFGQIAFEVITDEKGAPKRVMTFNELTRSRKAKYAQHKYLDKKPKLQATGFEADTVTFSMRLLAEAGVNPSDELDKLGRMLNSQKAYRLVIGDENLGRFYLVEITEARKRIDNKGNLTGADVALKLMEATS